MTATEKAKPKGMREYKHGRQSAARDKDKGVKAAVAKMVKEIDLSDKDESALDGLTLKEVEEIDAALPRLRLLPELDKSAAQIPTLTEAFKQADMKRNIFRDQTTTLVAAEMAKYNAKVNASIHFEGLPERQRIEAIPNSRQPEFERLSNAARDARLMLEAANTAEKEAAAIRREYARWTD
jgi:hypothetical protein